MDNELASIKHPRKSKQSINEQKQSINKSSSKVAKIDKLAQIKNAAEKTVASENKAVYKSTQQQQQYKIEVATIKEPNCNTTETKAAAKLVRYNSRSSINGIITERIINNNCIDDVDKTKLLISLVDAIKSAKCNVASTPTIEIQQQEQKIENKLEEPFYDFDDLVDSLNLNFDENNMLSNNQTFMPTCVNSDNISTNVNGYSNDEELVNGLLELFDETTNTNINSVSNECFTQNDCNNIYGVPLNPNDSISINFDVFESIVNSNVNDTNFNSSTASFINDNIVDNFLVDNQLIVV